MGQGGLWMLPGSGMDARQRAAPRPGAQAGDDSMTVKQLIARLSAIQDQDATINIRTVPDRDDIDKTDWDCSIISTQKIDGKIIITEGGKHEAKLCIESYTPEALPCIKYHTC
jgi:hypothetical protein